jgi:hypothetical protein
MSSAEGWTFSKSTRTWIWTIQFGEPFMECPPYYREAGGLPLTRRAWRRRACQTSASATTNVIAAITQGMVGLTK